MATKNNPGQFDCYANALPDEPMFVLLARDDSAHILVALWVALKTCDLKNFDAVQDNIGEYLAKRAAEHKTLAPDKAKEALRCAIAMQQWKALNENV